MPGHGDRIVSEREVLDDLVCAVWGATDLGDYGEQRAGLLRVQLSAFGQFSLCLFSFSRVVSSEFGFAAS